MIYKLKQYIVLLTEFEGLNAQFYFFSYDFIEIPLTNVQGELD